MNEEDRSDILCALRGVAAVALLAGIIFGAVGWVLLLGTLSHLLGLTAFPGIIAGSFTLAGGFLLTHKGLRKLWRIEG